MSRLDEIRERLSSAWSKPWSAGKRNGSPADTLSILGAEREYDYGGDTLHTDHPVIADVWVGNAGRGGVDLIANAPTDLADLLAFAQEISDAWHNTPNAIEFIRRTRSALTELGEA